MEQGEKSERDDLKDFSGLVIQILDGEIVETAEDTGSSMFNYDAQLAVLDENDEPYGSVDSLFIAERMKYLLPKYENGRTSIEIMSEAIHEASDLGLESIAISADNIDEIESVKQAVIDIFRSQHQLKKIGFYYPCVKDT